MFKIYFIKKRREKIRAIETTGFEIKCDQYKVSINSWFKE